LGANIREQAGCHHNGTPFAFGQPSKVMQAIQRSLQRTGDLAAIPDAAKGGTSSIVFAAGLLPRCTSGVEDSMIQQIRRHPNVNVTRKSYRKTVPEQSVGTGRAGSCIVR
jgi:hypothetical protein